MRGANSLPRRPATTPSRGAEERSREVLRAEREDRWLDENRAALDAFERFVEKNGVFNEDVRDW